MSVDGGNTFLEGAPASAPAHSAHDEAGRIAFLPIRDLHLPHNNRELYLSRELARRGWQVVWLRPHSGTNQGVPLEWEVLEYRDLEVRGRKYLFPAYLAGRLRAAGIRIVWLSGWTIRDLEELRWLTRTLRAAGVDVIYDPVDPVCEFAEAQGGADDGARCRERARLVYENCALITCVTPEIRDLLAASGAPRDRLHVARWGTDGSRFDPALTTCDLKQRLGLPANTFLAGWLGTMEPFKGLQEVILPLVARVGAAERGIHFVIAGRGTLEHELRQWARSRRDLPVSVLSSVEYCDAPNFTGSLDAYLVPTNPHSGFAQAICPVKCFDALAMGTPLIVTRTRATEFLAEHSELVRLADFDAESFAVALLERFRSPDRWKRDAGIREYTHQGVSRGLADAVSALHRRSQRARHARAEY